MRTQKETDLQEEVERLNLIISNQITGQERLTAELKATQDNEQRLVDANKPLLADTYRLQARVDALEGAVTRALKRRGCKHPNCQAAMNILAATEQGESDE